MAPEQWGLPMCGRATCIILLMHGQVVARLMLVLLAASAGASQAHGQDARPPDDKGTFSLLIENDALYDADRDYTNGLRLAWQSSENVPSWVRWVGDQLPFVPIGSRRRYGLAAGQSIFTPEDRSRRDVIPDDRPYAGWLYGAVSLTADTGRTLDNYELQLGVVGPKAQGEWLQENVHRALGSHVSQGWHNQLDNEFGAVLFYERRWRGLLEASPNTLGVDITPHAGFALGNVYTYAAAGAAVRFGWDLPSDYGPPRVRPALPGTDFFNPRAGFGWYLFAGAEGRAVARDIFLDGNTFTDSHSVDKRPFVADLQAGIAVTINAVRIALTQVYRTPEFEERDRVQRFGALSVSVRW
jgi:lipid A 3-O-deacylase